LQAGNRAKLSDRKPVSVSIFNKLDEDMLDKPDRRNWKSAASQALSSNKNFVFDDLVKFNEIDRLV